MDREESLRTNKANNLVLMVPVVIILLAAVVMGIMAVQVLSYFALPVVALIFLEVLLAFISHDANFWGHGIVIAVQLIAAFLCGKELLAVCCIATYIATVLALHISRQGESN
ncbi:hypothetical protein SAMN04487761_14510 [Lachnospiraceae bacterium C7]|nr:hypothetical protein SAMN04487761_14510 [Lachnospiraceae bacterium C7]